VIVIIIFGAGKLPEIGGALGKGIKEFKTESTAPEDNLSEGSGGTKAPIAASRTDETKVVETQQMRPDEI
jgi:TatA/E family protein of Tat protein translocase